MEALSPSQSPPAIGMSETPKVNKSTINTPEVVVIEFVRRLDTYGPNSSEILAPVVKPVEVKPVSWDGPNDPKNPQNWTSSKKWSIMAINGIVAINVYVLYGCSLRLPADD